MKKKFYKTIGFYIFLIAALTIGIFLYQTMTLNLIPGLYLLLLCIFMILILLIGACIAFKWKVIGNIFLCLLIALSGIGNFYLYKTQNLFGNISQSGKDTMKFSVAALKNHPEKLKTTGILTIGNLEFQKEALEKLDGKYQTIQYDSYTDFGQALYDKKTDTLLVSDNSMEFLEESFPDFQKDIEIIETFNISIESKTVDSSIDILQEPFNMYISGKDAEGIDSLSRSDVNIIMTINPNTHQILMTGVPRDFYIPQTCQNNQSDKLTHTGMFGIACTVDSMEGFLDVPIDYYAEVNFNSLVQVVDALGGITVHSPHAFTAGEYQFIAGNNELNGQQALAFSRERYAFEDGDRERSRNQMRVLEAIIHKAMSPSIITSYPKLMDSLQDCFKTNLSQKEITSFIKAQIVNMKAWDIEQIQVNGMGDSLVSPALGFEVYMMIPDQKTVDNAQKLIEKVLKNEKITPEDIQHQNDLVSKANS